MRLWIRGDGGGQKEVKSARGSRHFTCILMGLVFGVVNTFNIYKVEHYTQTILPGKAKGKCFC